MDRRTFLVTGLMAAGLAGCTRQQVQPPPAAGTAPSPSAIPTSVPQGADVDVRAALASTELGLIWLYRAALASMPGRSRQLQAVLDDHVQHLANVSPGTDLPAVAQPPPTGATPAEAGDPAEAGRRVRLRELLEAETRAQQQHAAACQAAQDPALARTLCLISASEAQHALALRRPTGRVRSS